MDRSGILFRLLVSVFAISCCSAYVNRPYCHTYRQFIHEYRPQSIRRYGLETSASFEEGWDPISYQKQGNPGDRGASKKSNIPSPDKAHNVAQFCFEVGCTIHEYQRITKQLKQLKVELSDTMLRIEDELDRIRDDPKTFSQVGTPSSLPFQFWFSSLIALRDGDGSDRNGRERSINSNKTKQNMQTSSLHGNVGSGGSIDFLLDQHRKLSDRALAIQNLLTTLRAMEESRPAAPTASPPGAESLNTNIVRGQSNTVNIKPASRQKTPSISIKELANRYWGILEKEGIKISPRVEFNIRETQKEASVLSYWEYLLTLRRQPKPPRLPPTVREFMNQCNSDQVNGAIGDNTDDKFDEECIKQWFSGTRLTMYPVATSIASNISTKKFGRTRVTANPFSGNANTTSTPR